MAHAIKKALAKLAEYNTDYEAVETFSKTVSAFEEVGLKYGEDFVLNGVKDEKLHFSFSSADSLNLALKTLRGE